MADSPKNVGSPTTVKSVGAVSTTPGRLSALVVIEGDDAVTIPLPTEGLVTVGRAADCELQIDHPSVSRHHARLRLGDQITIEDLRSANGTRIGDQWLEPARSVRLAPGRVVTIGDAVLVLQGVAAAAPERRFRDHEHFESRVDTGPPILGETMRQLEVVVARIAASTLPVLVLGETGVGKEILAETIHRLSPRAAGPLVRLNCAALSETLVESELFGYERGAFTGAQQAKEGLLESAAGGTVFFDEVGELPLSLQAKLLRVLEDKEVRPVGALRPRAIDVRFVAATNRDLESEIARGAFREDLYFRLGGVGLVIPPLRERTGEILPLAESFLARAAAEASVATPGFTDEVEAALVQYPWPGNVRELKSTVERAVLLAGDQPIGFEHLGRIRTSGGTGLVSAPPAQRPEQARRNEDVTALEAEVEQAKRTRIADALARSGGNQKEAAKLLGVSRRTLLNWLDQYGFERPRKRRPR